MTKGQKNGNKETRKPKADKKPAVAATVSDLMTKNAPIGRMPKAKS